MRNLDKSLFVSRINCKKLLISTLSRNLAILPHCKIGIGLSSTFLLLLNSLFVAVQIGLLDLSVYTNGFHIF